MNIKIVAAAFLLCAACADNDPFQTFYVPGYQMTAISGRPPYSGPPLPPGTTDPPVEYIQIINAEQAKSIGRHFAALVIKESGFRV